MISPVHALELLDRIVRLVPHSWHLQPVAE
jgi:hypothetical protein